MHLTIDGEQKFISHSIHLELY